MKRYTQRQIERGEYAHTHVYRQSPHIDPVWRRDRAACQICGFSIPRSLVGLALEQGASAYSDLPQPEGYAS